MHPALSRALQPVLRDMASTDVPAPERIEGDAWDAGPGTASAMVRSRDGSGIGVSIDLHAPFVDQVAQATRQVHEWAIEELGSTTRTNWPPCPRHPGTHPLELGGPEGENWWACPRDGTLVVWVGRLS